MIKIYTTNSNTSNNAIITPKRTVLDNILNFSKALEVLKTKEPQVNALKIEVILN